VSWRRRALGVVALLAALAVRAEPALPPLTLLTAGKTATLRNPAGTARDLALFRVGRDPELARLESPLCPGTSFLQVAGYPVASNLVESQPAAAPGAALPCERWRAVRGGYRYTDRAGSVLGVRSVVYTRDGIVVRIQGAGYTAIAGPVGYVELWLTVGGKRYLARYHNFRRNDAGEIIARRPSSPAASGERFFWQTLWGDAQREQETLDCLADAARRDRRDGRSRFLLGMMHLYRLGQATTDYGHVTDFARAEVRAARSAFDAAVPLLWDARRRSGDNRVPGFAAASTYLAGTLLGDEATRHQGLVELDAAVALNPIFNAFDLIGVVPQFVSGADPLYGARVLAILDDTLTGPGAACVVTQPEVCANDGMAPNNLAGALVLFGDLYLKGTRPADVAKASTWYAVASAAGAGWKFLNELDARRGQEEARRQRYLDADPANDPALIGLGVQACSYCHIR
jgi:hypothetical protein